MKTHNISIFSCLLITFLLSTPVNAQTEDDVKRLVKKNLIEVCECFKQFDYIDSFADFDIKFDQCLQASTNDNTLKQDEDIFEQYTHSMHEQQMQSCDTYASKLDFVLLRPEPKLSDPIYNNQNRYKETANNIVGEYSMSFNMGHSPEGGPTLALLDNQRYVIASFGIVLVGDWRIVKGKYLHLLPYRTRYPFFVFGRQNTNLGNTTIMKFKGDGFSESTLIRYSKIDQEVPTLTPILHVDNQYPYKAEVSNIPKAFSLAYNSDYKVDEAVEIYTFDNNQNFNDFSILEFNGLAHREAMKAIIGDNELTFEQGNTKKRPLPEASTPNAQFYTEMSEIKPFPKTLYYNLAGRSFDSERIDQDNYTFDNNLKAYVANTMCGKNCPAEDDYDNTDIFYEYKSLEDVTRKLSRFKVANTFAVPRDFKD